MPELPLQQVKSRAIKDDHENWAVILLSPVHGFNHVLSEE